MIKLTESHVISKVQEIIEKANSTGLRNLEFIGFKNKPWTNRKDCILIIKCNIHNKITEVSYRVFTQRVHNKVGFFGCSECTRDDRKRNRNKQRFLNEEEATNAINKKIEELKTTKGLDFSFIGFETEFTNLKNTKIILRCNLHNITESTSLYKFINFGHLCSKCRSLPPANIINNNQLIYNELTQKYGPLYDFSSILKEPETPTHGRKIKFICPVHGLQIKGLRALLDSKEDIPCSQCILDNRRAINEKDCIEEINKAIQWRKETFGVNYEFCGFVEDFKNKSTTFAKIKCLDHNETWEVNSHSFITAGSISGCPKCGIFPHVYEDICYKILLNLGLTVKRWYVITCYDDILKTNRTLKPDFYIESLNLIIEYDGEQHYKFIEMFHGGDINNYKDQVRRDQLKEKYCKDNNIKFLRISYKDNKRLEDIIKTYINTGVDISIKVTPEVYD